MPVERPKGFLLLPIQRTADPLPSFHSDSLFFLCLLLRSPLPPLNRHPENRTGLQKADEQLISLMMNENAGRSSYVMVVTKCDKVGDKQVSERTLSFQQRERKGIAAEQPRGKNPPPAYWGCGSAAMSRGRGAPRSHGSCFIRRRFHRRLPGVVATT